MPIRARRIPCQIIGLLTAWLLVGGVLGLIAVGCGFVRLGRVTK